MSNRIGQDRAVLYFQPGGPYTKSLAFALGASSVTGKSRPGPQKTAVYGVNRFGQPVVIFTQRDAPSGLPEATVGWYDTGDVGYLEQRQNDGQTLFLQVRIIKCGALDNPQAWDVVDHMAHGLVGSISPSDGPVTPYAGEILSNEAGIMFDYTFRLVRTSLTALQSGVAVNLNDVIMVSDPIEDCGIGYPGPDKLVFVAANAVALAIANILVSNNGGGAFTSIVGPFGADDHVGHMSYDWVNNDTIRLWVANPATVAGNLPEFAYADIELGTELSAYTWHVVESASADAAVAEFVSAMEFINGKLYIGVDAGRIYITDGEIWASDADYSGAVQINGFVANHEKSIVYAFGQSNLLLVEQGGDGVFSARVGPAGGGNFTALTVFNNDHIVAGNGTKLFLSKNGGRNAGGWTEIKDFGVGKAVVEILKTGGEQSLGGDSQCWRVVVDDSVGGNASIYETVDGGGSFRKIDELTNLGYNAGAFSTVNNNLAITVGDIDASGNGAIHRLS